MILLLLASYIFSVYVTLIAGQMLNKLIAAEKVVVDEAELVLCFIPVANLYTLLRLQKFVVLLVFDIDVGMRNPRPPPDCLKGILGIGVLKIARIFLAGGKLLCNYVLQPLSNLYNWFHCK